MQLQKAIAAKKKNIEILQKQKAASKARAVEVLRKKAEILAKKEEHQKNLDAALAQMFDSAPKIEEIVKKQKAAKGKARISNFN